MPDKDILLDLSKLYWSPFKPELNSKYFIAQFSMSWQARVDCHPAKLGGTSGKTLFPGSLLRGWEELQYFKHFKNNINNNKMHKFKKVKLANKKYHKYKMVLLRI